MKKYWTVAALGWQDSLVYRFNALVWVLYAVLPSLTIMLVWIAAYRNDPTRQVSGFDLSEMITYYVFITALSVVITPHPEWETAQFIRDGKITPFIVRPMGFFGYKVAQETSYQIIKSAMFLPAFAAMIFLFRDYIKLPPFDAARLALFVLSSLLAYILLTQMKFLLAISAFWFAEVTGLLEISNTFVGVLGGRWIPIALLPPWLQTLTVLLPFASTYAFPIELLMNRLDTSQIVIGFATQIAWIAVFTILVKVTWKRGLLAYEAYGG